MCGRVFIDHVDQEICALVEEMNRSVLAGRFRKEDGEPLTAQGEIFPSAVLPVLAVSRAGNPGVFPMKWGFSQNKRLLINARAETAAEKPTFRDAWRGHRCIIPVSWYFEWAHDAQKRPTQKYAIRPEESGILRLAGLYRMEEGLPAFVILTRPADEKVLWMHDRMPVMFAEQEAGKWIRPDEDPEQLVRKCLTDVIWKQAG